MHRWQRTGPDLDHRESRTGNTEHHAGEEAGHIHAEAPANDIAGDADIAGLKAGPVVLQVSEADGVKPEYIVQRVVQAGRDEQTVKECIDAGADTVHADDAFANSYQRAEDDRPYEQQDNGYRDGNQTGYDGNAALAAEECQPVRELRVFEAVIAACADDTGDDSDKYVLDLVKCQRFYRIIRDCGHQRGNNAGAQQVGHHQPGYQTGQCRGTLAVVG